MSIQVHLVLVEFGQQHEKAALELLHPTIRRLFPGADVRTVIVDNAQPEDGDVEVGNRVYRIAGNNMLREFSGWDRGVAWIERRYAPGRGSIFVLANDTVARPDKHDRVRDTPPERAAAAVAGAIVGWIDEYPRPVELFGLDVRQWIDTSFVLVSAPVLQSLGPLARPVDDDLVFADWRRIFREPSPLSPNYRGYLKAYFFGDAGASDFEHRWYAQQAVNADNFDAFKAKLRCVFCEHLLSARARALGIPFVDIRRRPLAIDPLDVVLS
jgi:hypothetical protein